MSGTGYFVNTGTSAAPVYKDLVEIFQANTSNNYAGDTGFKATDGRDLNKYFEKLSAGTPINYNTNMISLTSGIDLRNVFLPIRPSLTIKVPDGNFYYSYTTTDGYTVVIFADYTSKPDNPPVVPTTNIGYTDVSGITVSFNNFSTSNPVYVTAVGGGGGGGNKITPTATNLYDGGGGGGGGVSTVSLTPTTGQLYSINVGGGGVAQNAGSTSSMGKTGTRESVVISFGGLPGTNSTSSGEGTGGSGGTSIPPLTVTGSNGGNGGASGDDSPLFAIYPNTSYYFGGGGGSTSVGGGLGGGGDFFCGNNCVPYIGPTSIYYFGGDGDDGGDSIYVNGYPGVGGGGGGGTSGSGRGDIGGQGGSGVVILCYKTVNPQSVVN